MNRSKLINNLFICGLYYYLTGDEVIAATAWAHAAELLDFPEFIGEA